MPENYYCANFESDEPEFSVETGFFVAKTPDNFFKKMTDLESPRKNNDCYFYYYSTCAKGDNCTFRHEPSALGCETMCSFWKEGKCLNVHCNFRHMELRKNRKVIPCYWESQPGGCLKPHCPFMHQNPKPAGADETNENKNDSGTESAEKLSRLSEKSFKNAPVDSLVVNFEEESDNESAPTNSPIKSGHRVVKVKTLEEIKLEKIQAESAAYYSYPENESAAADDLRQRIWDRLSKKEVKKRPAADAPAVPNKRLKKNTDVGEIKIKTLEEIRAERAKKNPDSADPAICDSSVSSSTEDDEKMKKPAKIKLQRKPLYIQENKDEEGGVENKTVDEVLLLQDDDDTCNVSLKEEEKLLDEFEDFLKD